jgi:WD40 repeat protein
LTRESIRLIDDRCDRYETEWMALHSPRIEDYVEGVEGEVLHTLWLELVMLDQELRLGAGETVRIEDYQDQCPDRSIWLDVSTVGLTPSPTLVDPGRDRSPAVDPSREAAMPPSEPIIDPLVTTPGSLGILNLPIELPATDGLAKSGEIAPPVSQVQPGPGTVLGDYVVLGLLAEGGMGVVYKALQQRLHRIVALKMIKAGAWAHDRDIRLFQAEAEAIASLDHPHIVSILETGEYAGRLYYSMKLIAGTSLQDNLVRFKDQSVAMARLMVQIAEAIHHAHERGVLHGDLKPSNILVDECGEPHVIDFGLARRLGGTGSDSIFAEGSAVGTPSYMAPEQARGQRQEITTATDVYGLGGLLYALLTGRPPFVGSLEETLRQVKQDEPQRPQARNPQADRDLETICLKCMDKEPKKRYASAREVAEDLKRWLAGEPILARPASTTERIWKFIRRHRAISLLIGLLVFALSTGVGGITWQWRVAIAARQGEHDARLQAERHEDEARQIAYAAKLNLAQRDQQDANNAEALRHLEETHPQPGKTDLRGFEWYYLDRLCRSQGRTLAGHRDTVWRLAYSPDGRRLASASAMDDQTVKIWDVEAGQVIHTIKTSDDIDAVVFHPDGTQLASAGKGRIATLWDAATGQAIRTYREHTDRVSDLAFTPNGKTLASSSHDGTIKLWDVAAGTPMRSLPDHHSGQCGAIAFSPDGKSLASAGGGERTVRVWDAATGKLIRTLENDIIPDGNRSPSPDVKPAPDNAVVSLAIQPWMPVAFSPDGQTLASGAEDGTIRFWAVADWRARSFRDSYNLAPILSLRFTPNGRVLATASHTSQAVTLWDAQTGFRLGAIKGHNRVVTDIAFSPDGSTLASASGDHTVKLWDTTRDQEARTLRARAVVKDLAFGPDGSYLISAGQDRTATLWDLATGQAVRTFQGHTGRIASVAISRDGRRAASAGDDQSIRIWDVATGKEIRALRGHAGTVSDVAFSPDGKTLASGSGDRTVKFWDVDSGREIKTLLGHHFRVVALSFSPDGKTLASADEGTSFILFWDITSGRQLQPIMAHRDGISAMALSPDGRHLATAGHDHLLKVWDRATGQLVHTLEGHASIVFGLAFSPDGRRLASASADRTVRIWDPIFGQELLVLRGHTGLVYTVAFSPDGNRLASGSSDRTVKLWEANSKP